MLCLGIGWRKISVMSQGQTLNGKLVSLCFVLLACCCCCTSFYFNPTFMLTATKWWLVFAILFRFCFRIGESRLETSYGDFCYISSQEAVHLTVGVQLTGKGKRPTLLTLLFSVLCVVLYLLLVIHLHAEDEFWLLVALKVSFTWNVGWLEKW